MRPQVTRHRLLFAMARGRSGKMVSPRASMATSAAIFFARPAGVLCGWSETPARTDSDARACGRCCVPAGWPRWPRVDPSGWSLRSRCAQGIGRVPAAVGLGRIHLPLAVRRHAAGRGQPRHMLAVDLAPDASRPPRRIALQKGKLLIFRRSGTIGAIDLLASATCVHSICHNCDHAAAEETELRSYATLN